MENLIFEVGQRIGKWEVVQVDYLTTGDEIDEYVLRLVVVERSEPNVCNSVERSMPNVCNSEKETDGTV